MATRSQPPAPGSAPASPRRRTTQPTGPAKTAYQPQQATSFAIIEQAQKGVPTQQVDQLAELLGISLKEMAIILQVAERTLHRFRSEGKLDPQTSERLLLLKNLTAHGLLIFDGRAEALADWLRYPLRELKGKAPLQWLNTISGFNLVDDVLTRIEYGVYS